MPPYAESRCKDSKSSGLIVYFLESGCSMDEMSVVGLPFEYFIPITVGFMGVIHIVHREVVRIFFDLTASAKGEGSGTGSPSEHKERHNHTAKSC